MQSIGPPQWKRRSAVPSIPPDVSQALEQLNALPGAIGSLVTDRGGNIIERAFPCLFDDATLSAVSGDVAECASVLGISSASTKTLFLRYAEGIVAIKPLDDGLLLLLCTRESSRELMSRSLDDAAARLRKDITSPALHSDSGPPGWASV